MVIVKTIVWAKKKFGCMVLIHSISFDEKKASWTVEVKQARAEDQEYEAKIKDE